MNLAVTAVLFVVLFSVNGWLFVRLQGIPQQKNDSDCGVFVLEVRLPLLPFSWLHLECPPVPHLTRASTHASKMFKVPLFVPDGEFDVRRGTSALPV